MISPKEESKDSSRIELINKKPINGRNLRQKIKESHTKNMWVDTQDFDEIFDSSCFESYHNYMGPKADYKNKKFNNSKFELPSQVIITEVNKDKYKTLKNCKDIDSLDNDSDSKSQL
jgi:hypothetical protein